MIHFDTARCHIRSFRLEDLDAFMAYRNDPDWMRYQAFKGLTRTEYTKILLERTRLTEGLQLAIISKTTDQLIGDLYLKQDGERCWIGYTISPVYARQGYACEVLSALIAYLKERGFTELKAAVLPNNTASLALLKKCGFIFSTVEDGEQIFSLII